MLSEHDLLTLRAAARQLRIPADWLRAEAESGRVPALRAHDELLFHFPTVVQVLGERAAQRSDAPPAAPPASTSPRGRNPGVLP
jgi:hypothetical protein